MSNLTNEFKGKLKKYFHVKLGAFTYRHGWDKCKCPYCGRDGKFGINISRNRCNCFRCGEHPLPIQLVMYLESVDTYAEAIKILNQAKYDGYIFKEEKVELKSRKDLYLPEGFKLLTVGNSELAKSARNYVTKRGFNVKEVAMSGWGYGTQGKYFGYLIIPFMKMVN